MDSPESCMWCGISGSANETTGKEHCEFQFALFYCIGQKLFSNPVLAYTSFLIIVQLFGQGRPIRNVFLHFEIYMNAEQVLLCQDTKPIFSATKWRFVQSPFLRNIIFF